MHALPILSGDKRRGGVVLLKALGLVMMPILPQPSISLADMDETILKLGEGTGVVELLMCIHTRE
jgi:hypothetical protein